MARAIIGNSPLLVGRNLSKSFPDGTGQLLGKKSEFRVLSDININLYPNKTLGIVGESGCGKSTLGKILLGLLTPDCGELIYQGENLADLSSRRWRELRADLQIIFQDIGNSLDPRLSVITQVREPLDIHRILPKNQRDSEAAKMLQSVKLGSSLWSRAPHELSGGQLQRVILARALITRPKLIVCDEPVSALDVSIQAQIINLLKDLQEEFGLAYLFISHDLSIIRHMADQVAVMYLGKIVEQAAVNKLFDNPLHPYTKSLLNSVPIPDPHLKRKTLVLRGDPPNPNKPPPGCSFHPRCPIAIDQCSVAVPKLAPVENRHEASCFLAGTDTHQKEAA